MNETWKATSQQKKSYCNFLYKQAQFKLGLTFIFIMQNQMRILHHSTVLTSSSWNEIPLDRLQHCRTEGRYCKMLLHPSGVLGLSPAHPCICEEYTCQPLFMWILFRSPGFFPQCNDMLIRWTFDSDVIDYVRGYVPDRTLASLPYSASHLLLPGMSSGNSRNLKWIKASSEMVTFIVRLSFYESARLWRHYAVYHKNVNCCTCNIRTMPISQSTK